MTGFPGYTRLDLRRTEHEVAPVARKKVPVRRIDSDEDLPEALSRNRPEATTRVSLAKPRRTEHGAAHKNVSARVESDEDLPEGPPCTASKTEATRTQSSEKSSTRGQLDKLKSYASTLDGDDGRDYGNHDDVNAYSIQWDSEPEIGSAIQDDVDAAAAPEDNNDTAPGAPPPQKKAKKASTRSQMAPPRRNATRAKRANGF
ncbi:hypothetical protein HD554DRAFT_2179277 [Boletus coccyginus]|nr:hypothetical protein HD554DRAFT_2179277 [Boletus coccyginus]